MSGSSNLIMATTVAQGRKIKFEVMPSLGSRKFDLLPLRMRIYVGDVIFTSSQTVVIHDLYHFQLIHYHMNGTLQEQDDEEVKKVIAKLESIIY